jgi:predicted transcriptional regulator
MFIKDYISKDYPAFSVRDSIEEASEVAKEFGYSHVFIVNKGIFLGGLSQPFLEDSPKAIWNLNIITSVLRLWKTAVCWTASNFSTPSMPM